MAKYALSESEINLLVEGLGALVREEQRMAADAFRLGYRAQAVEFSGKADQAAALLSLAESTPIERITVRY